MIHIYKQILKPCFLCLVLGLFSLIGCNSSQNGLNSNQGTGGMEKDLNANEKFYDDEEALNKAIEESLRIEEGEEGGKEGEENEEMDFRAIPHCITLSKRQKSSLTSTQRFYNA